MAGSLFLHIPTYFFFSVLYAHTRSGRYYSFTHSQPSFSSLPVLASSVDRPTDRWLSFSSLARFDINSCRIYTVTVVRTNQHSTCWLVRCPFATRIFSSFHQLINICLSFLKRILRCVSLSIRTFLYVEIEP